MMSHELIGKRIKSLRIALCVTRKELSQHVFVSPYSIANYEVGRRMPDIETLWLMADYLGVTIDELVGRTLPENCRKCSGNKSSDTSSDQTK